VHHVDTGIIITSINTVLINMQTFLSSLYYC